MNGGMEILVISLYLAFVWVVATDVLHPVAIATTTTTSTARGFFGLEDDKLEKLFRHHHHNLSGSVKIARVDCSFSMLNYQMPLFRIAFVTRRNQY